MDAPEFLNPSVRTSKKRDAEDHFLLQTANKRVVLGDITNSVIFGSSDQCLVSDEEMTDTDLDEEELPEASSVDCLKKSGSAFSIYEHLRSLEVWIFASVSEFRYWFLACFL